VQALVDPATGEQVTLSPNSNAAGNVSGAAAVQVITVADPVTGEPVQQMVQTVVDPSTGQTIQVPVQSNAAGGGGGGNTQIVMVNNPVTGEQMQQVVQTVVDPTTGKTVQIPVDSSSNNGAQIVTVTDPQTGQPVQQIVQTVIDPATGKPTQVMTPLSNTQNGLPTNDDSILDLYNGRAPVDVLEGILSSALEEGDIGIISRMLSIITDTTPNLAGKILLRITQKKKKKKKKNQTAKNLVKWEFILSKNNCAAMLIYMLLICLL